MKNIIYLAMDNIKYMMESFASITSLLHTVKHDVESYRIIIYTNMVKQAEQLFLDKLNISLVIKEVDDETKMQWIGEHRYIYRLKIWALIDFIEQYQEPAMFIDTDTFFIDDASELFAKINTKKVIIMDYIENYLIDMIKPAKGNRRHNNTSKFYYENYNNKKLCINENEYYFTDSLQFWNSGVIGLHHDFLNYLYEALEFTDYMLDNYQLITTEQIALSCVFQQYCQIDSADKVVFHYWFMKEVRYLVEDSLDLPIHIDVKYQNSSVIGSINELIGKIKYQDLIEQIIKLVYIKNVKLSKALLDVMSTESYFGQLLREKSQLLGKGEETIEREEGK